MDNQAALVDNASPEIVQLVLGIVSLLVLILSRGTTSKENWVLVWLSSGKED